MTSTRIVEHLGRVLGGRYRLLAPIGTGASAHVFLADDVKLRRRVAVKLLHPALADDSGFLRRFRAEARAAAALNHPNVMAVYDWGEEIDGPYLVCEFLGGGSLRAILDRGTRLTPSQALGVGLEAARALDYASRRGLVHRDIKPANLLFDDEGRLRIADFGLARALAEASWTEPAGAVLGTARYASPEQVKGSPLDGRADVYSLALVLFEAVTGRVPFAADTTVGTLLGRLDRPIPADPALGPLGPIVARAGRPDPAERLDAMALGAALQAAAAELPAPDPLPLAGLAFLDETLAPLDRDPTDLGQEPASPVGDESPRTTPVAVASPPPVDDTVPLPAAQTRPTAPPAAPSPAPTVELSPPGRLRRRWPIVLLVVLVLAAGGAAGAWALVQARVPSRPVPDTVNRPEAEAVAALRALEFEVRIQRAFVNGTAAGQVTAQDPAANTKLKEGRTVTLTVSQGPVPVPVPDLSGKDRNAAVDAIQKGGLTVGKVTSKHDEEAPAGRVLDWSPKGGMAPTGSPVDLTLSSGPAPRVVPDLKGQSYEAAAAALGRQGLKVAKGEAYSDTVPQGQVIGTNPQAGASVDRGSTVTVVVSRGQPEVPNLRGLSVADATARLAAADLKLGNVYGPPGGRVFHTIPIPGTKVKAGTTVTLFIL
ncbi:MAG TPA: PASTA domain-containing protein [Acidimicrobiales bacterium]|nr:PASTA domain-containing protein [Acidimicrobiales bacterium]